MEHLAPNVLVTVQIVAWDYMRQILTTLAVVEPENISDGTLTGKVGHGIVNLN